MRSWITIVVLFFVCVAYTQEQTSGMFKLINGDSLHFKELEVIKDQYWFINLETLEKEHLYKTSVQEIIYNKDSRYKATEKLERQYGNTTYPDGIYETKESFIAKKPTKVVEVTPFNYQNKEIEGEVEHFCFFRYTSNNKKLRKIFAVVYKGDMYFSNYAILTHRHKKDRAQTSTRAHGFAKVIMQGDNFIYTETDLANAWAQGLAYGGIGGAVGGAIASTMYKGKGVVWDVKNNEFNIFRNCKDYNFFMTDNYKDGVQVCENQQPDMAKVREAIEVIK